MKIVEVAEFYSAHGGGVRTYLQQMLACCARLGHETVIVAPGAEDREQAVPGGRIVWVKAPRLPLDPRYHMFVSSTGVERVLAREAPDVVVAGSPWKGGWIVARWRDPARAVQPVKALFMHADPVAIYAYTAFGGLLSRARIDRAFAWFWRYLARLSACFDATLVSSPWLAERFGRFGLARLRAVPFGVELSTFSPALRDEGLRARMLGACGLPPEAALVIAVGRHHPEKRLGTVIKAVARAQRVRPVGLYMVGDGPIRRWVDFLASRTPHVHVAGHVGDRARIAALMASADVLLHGSGAETYGRVLAEALASGLPVVVPDEGGAAGFAAPGYAEVYQTGDAAAAAGALLRLLARGRREASAAAAAAARDAIGREDDHFVRLCACFEELLAARPAPGVRAPLPDDAATAA